MVKRQVCGTAVVVACMLGLPFASPSASAATVFVDSSDAETDADGCGGGAGGASDPCNTIQAGVDAAAPFDLVSVAPSIYEGQVAVNKQGLAIHGAKAGIPGQDRERDALDESLYKPPGGNVAGFTVSADDVTIAGFRIEGASSNAGESAPGIAVSANGAVIQGNVIEHNAPGVRIAGERASVVENAFYDNDTGPFPQTSGIQSSSAPFLDVSDNLFAGAGQVGVDLFGSSDSPEVSIDDNVFEEAPVGVIVARLTASSVTSNSITGGETGISFALSDDLVISGNSITGQSDKGIYANWVNLPVPPQPPQNRNVQILANDLSDIGDPSRAFETAAINLEPGSMEDTLFLESNRIARNVTTIIDWSSPIAAPDNWWGCSEGLSTCGSVFANTGTVEAEPHLVLSAGPAQRATVGEAAVVSASIGRNSDGAEVPLTTFLPPLPFELTKIDGPGVVGPAAGAGGTATAQVTSSVPGTTRVSVTLDDGTAETSAEHVPGPPGAPGSTASSKDTVSPIVQSASMKPRKFAVKRPSDVESARNPRGTRLRFSLSEKASVRVSIRRLRKGKKSRFAGALALAGGAGQNSRPFAGRVSGKWLRPGRYRATFVAKDDAGNSSKPKRVSFRIVRH